MKEGGKWNEGDEMKERVVFVLVMTFVGLLQFACERDEKRAEALFAPRREGSAIEKDVAASPVEISYDESLHRGVPEEAKKRWIEAFGLHKQSPYSYDKPLKLLGEAIKICPEYKMAYFTRGTILMKKYNETMDVRVLDKAIQSFRKTLELGADWVGLYNNLAFALILKGENEEAIAHLKVALEKKPDSIYVLNNLFEAYYNEGKFEEAKGYLEKAKALNPNHEITRHNWMKYNAAIQR
ncbi:MAG: hypothetical protein Kow0090_18540 [Myxococcota bacterium]